MAMIDVKELRIGNLVCFIDETGASPDYIETTVDMMVIQHAIKQDDFFQGIPITEERLIEIGFVEVMSNDYYKFFDFGEFRVFIHRSGDSVFIHWRGCEIDHLINNCFIHSIQNLFYALTGQELDVSKL